MAENTAVGPAGSNKGAMPAVKPVNHNTSARDGRTGGGSGRGADGSSAGLHPAGPLKPVSG